MQFYLRNAESMKCNCQFYVRLSLWFYSKKANFLVPMVKKEAMASTIKKFSTKFAEVMSAIKNWHYDIIWAAIAVHVQFEININ